MKLGAIGSFARFLIIIAGTACSSGLFAKPIEFELRILEVHTTTATLGDIQGKWVSVRASSDTLLMIRSDGETTFPILSTDVALEDTPIGTLRGTIDWPDLVMKFTDGGMIFLYSKSAPDIQGIVAAALPFVNFRFDRPVSLFNLVPYTYSTLPTYGEQVSWTPAMQGVWPYFSAASTRVGTLFVKTADPDGLAAVEYYHVVFDHYFVTASPDKIVKLDNDPSGGWVRTGEQLTASDWVCGNKQSLSIF